MMVTWCFFEGAPRVAILELKIRVILVVVVVLLGGCNLYRRFARESDSLELSLAMLYSTFLVSW